MITVPLFRAGVFGALMLCTTACQAAEPGADQSLYCAGEKGRSPSGRLEASRIELADNAAAGLYEGPVWRDGTLYFSHFLFSDGFPSKVLAYSPGQLRVAFDDSGSNGLALDDDGQLVAGTHKYKSVSRIDLSNGERSTLAGSYKGNVFNSPNDLTVARNGTLYFTDPDFQTDAAPGGQPLTGVYRVKGDEVVLVDGSIANPNGISLSPDEKTLYVAGGGQSGFVRAYDLTSPFPHDSRESHGPVTVPDGMAVDCLGNLYVTEHTTQRVRVVNPEGREIAHIQLDANVTNAAFGGNDGKTLFITGAGSLWQVPLEVSGFPY